MQAMPYTGDSKESYRHRKQEASNPLGKETFNIYKTKTKCTFAIRWQLAAHNRQFIIWPPNPPSTLTPLQNGSHDPMSPEQSHLSLFFHTTKTPHPRKFMAVEPKKVMERGLESILWFSGLQFLGVIFRFHQPLVNSGVYTPPKFNIFAPENGWLEYDPFLLGK